MKWSIQPAMARGRQFAFPAVWAAVFATGVGLGEPLPSLDIAPYLALAPAGTANGTSLEPVALPILNAEPEALIFVRHEISEPDDTFHATAREFAAWGHGRFAAPGNAVRRKVQLRATPGAGAPTPPELASLIRTRLIEVEEVTVERGNLDDVFRQITTSDTGAPHA